MTGAQERPFFINFVLDKSGSMGVAWRGTIDGFNTFLHEQQAVPSDAWLSLTLFDTSFDARLVAWGLRDVPDLGSRDNPYTTGGNTALFDAVGVTIEGTDVWLQRHPWFGERQGRVVCTILTDGEENSSKRWTQAAINDLIQAKQEQGWEFVFLGAGGSAWLERTFHVVAKDRFYAFEHDDEGSMNTHSGVSAALSRSRTAGVPYTAPPPVPPPDPAH